MHAPVNEIMTPMEKLIDFGVCIGMPDSSSVSFLNRFIVKPINWLIGQENTKKVSQFICRHIISRIVAVAASAFAAIDIAYNMIVSLGKLPLAALKAAGVKKIPEECSFSGIIDNLKNLGQSLLLTLTASVSGLIRPDLLGEFAYPIAALNKTPIFGYHEINPDIANSWTVSPKLFEQQLEHLYKNDYELCTFKEFLEGYTPPKGKKLAVITFDDSHESQFRVKGTDEKSSLIIDENCALGVFEKVKKKHPDFRCVATFYVNTSEEKGSTGNHNHTVFANNPQQKQYTELKLKHLLDQGYEIGSHGHLHRRFDKLTIQELKDDIANFDNAIDTLKSSAKEKGIDLESLEVVSFAWPHGMVPSKKKRAIVDERYKYIGDFGFNSTKVKQKTFLKNPEKCKTVPRIYIGPNTGFEQYVPKKSSFNKAS